MTEVCRRWLLRLCEQSSSISCITGPWLVALGKHIYSKRCEGNSIGHTWPLTCQRLGKFIPNMPKWAMCETSVTTTTILRKWFPGTRCNWRIVSAAEDIKRKPDWAGNEVALLETNERYTDHYHECLAFSFIVYETLDSPEWNPSVSINK